jgi:hypothetical protein
MCDVPSMAVYYYYYYGDESSPTTCQKDITIASGLEQVKGHILCHKEKKCIWMTVHYISSPTEVWVISQSMILRIEGSPSYHSKIYLWKCCCSQQ